MGREELELLSRLEETIRHRLVAYGRGRDRFGLTHNDLRLANLLLDGERMFVIDFDDCGDSWYMPTGGGVPRKRDSQARPDAIVPVARLLD